MRYVIGLLLGIGLIVLTFILIFKAFSGGGSKPAQQAITLTDYATTNAIVRYTVDGVVNSQQEHNRIRITVSKDTVLYEQIKGYEGTLVQSKTYPNNIQSYSNFLRSLQLAGFASGNTSYDNDERGYCPTGRRYVYEAVNGGDSIFRWWSTSCSGNQKSFRGSAGTIRTLFQRQVPDYSKLVYNVNV